MSRDEQLSGGPSATEWSGSHRHRLGEGHRRGHRRAIGTRWRGISFPRFRLAASARPARSRRWWRGCAPLNAPLEPERCLMCPEAERRTDSRVPRSPRRNATCYTNVRPANEAASQRWALALGNEHVIVEPAQLDRAETATYPTTQRVPRPSAVQRAVRRSRRASSSLRRPASRCTRSVGERTGAMAQACRFKMAPRSWI